MACQWVNPIMCHRHSERYTYSKLVDQNEALLVLSTRKVKLGRLILQVYVEDIVVVVVVVVLVPCVYRAMLMTESPLFERVEIGPDRV
jgi:hypothetical protein